MEDNEEFQELKIEELKENSRQLSQPPSIEENNFAKNISKIE